MGIFSRPFALPIVDFLVVSGVDINIDIVVIHVLPYLIGDRSFLVFDHPFRIELGRRPHPRSISIANPPV